MTTPSWSNTDVTSFLWSPVESDGVFRSWVLVMASLSAVFLRFAVVAVSFVLPWLAAFVETRGKHVEAVSQGSRPAVEKRVVPDEPGPGSGDARMRTVETSR